MEEAPPEDAWTEHYRDEITGALLDPELVRQARAAEVAFMHKLKVYEEATHQECIADGCKLIPTRRVDLTDAETPCIRSRAVLQVIWARGNLGPNDLASRFAATPPLED